MAKGLMRVLVDLKILANSRFIDVMALPESGDYIRVHGSLQTPMLLPVVNPNTLAYRTT